jgi:hypothetical protein
VDRQQWAILSRRVRSRRWDRGRIIIVNHLAGGLHRSPPHSTLTPNNPRSIVSVGRCRACPSLRMVLQCPSLRRHRIKLRMLPYINRRFLHRHLPLYHRDRDMATDTRCLGRYRRVRVGMGMLRRMEATTSLLRPARMGRYRHYPLRLLYLCLKGIRPRSLRLVRSPSGIHRNRLQRDTKPVTDRLLRFNLPGHQYRRTTRHSLLRTRP